MGHIDRLLKQRCALEYRQNPSGYFTPCSSTWSQSVHASAISGLGSKPHRGFVLARKQAEKKYVDHLSSRKV
jgi:hypothetical protein